MPSATLMHMLLTTFSPLLSSHIHSHDDIDIGVGDKCKILSGCRRRRYAFDDAADTHGGVGNTGSRGTGGHVSYRIRYHLLVRRSVLVFRGSNHGDRRSGRHVEVSFPWRGLLCSYDHHTFRGCRMAKPPEFDRLLYMANLLSVHLTDV